MASVAQIEKKIENLTTRISGEQEKILKAKGVILTCNEQLGTLRADLKAARTAEKAGGKPKGATAGAGASTGGNGGGTSGG